MNPVLLVIMLLISWKFELVTAIHLQISDEVVDVPTTKIINIKNDTSITECSLTCMYHTDACCAVGLLNDELERRQRRISCFLLKKGFKSQSTVNATDQSSVKLKYMIMENKIEASITSTASAVPTTTSTPLTTPPLTTTPSVPWSCSSQATNFNDHGNGLIWHLDRHHMNCSANHAMTSFKLEMSADLTTYRYVYECCAIRRVNNVCVSNRLVENDFTDVVDGEAFFLDRQKVKCDDDYLTSLRLDRSANRIRYVYNCCTIDDERTCSIIENVGTEESSDTAYLDRQNVECAQDQLLSEVRLLRSDNQFKYRYNCCT